MHQSPGVAACAQCQKNRWEVTGQPVFSEGSIRAKGRYYLKDIHNPVTRAA
jgi:hypothetical protein